MDIHASIKEPIWPRSYGTIENQYRMEVTTIVHSGPKPVLNREVELVLTAPKAAELGLILVGAIPVGWFETEEGKPFVKRLNRLVEMLSALESRKPFAPKEPSNG